jgi:hypothetical protein
MINLSIQTTNKHGPGRKSIERDYSNIKQRTISIPTTPPTTITKNSLIIPSSPPKLSNKRSSGSFTKEKISSSYNYDDEDSDFEYY